MSATNQPIRAFNGLLILLIAIGVSKGEILHCFHSSSNTSSSLVTRCVHVAILGPESNVCFSWRRLQQSSSEQMTEERGCQKRDLLLADLDEEQRQRVQLDDSSFCTLIKENKDDVESILCLCTTDLCNTRSITINFEKEQYKNEDNVAIKITFLLLMFSISIAFISN